MRNTRSDLKDSRFPLKLGLHSAPEWKRRMTVVTRSPETGQPGAGAGPTGPGGGERVRRSEQGEAEANRLGEAVHVTSDLDN